MRPSRSCRKKTAITVVINVLLLSTLSLWLAPTQEQWFPRFHKNVTLGKDSFVQRFPFTRRNLSSTLRILLWTPWFGDPDWTDHNISQAFSSCPRYHCVITMDKSDIHMADAVLFHSRDLWNYYLGYPLPEYRRADQVWILLNQEPPPHTMADLKKYNGVFNWTASYREDSDISMPYFKTQRRTKLPPVAMSDIAATKSAGIVWVASNCGDDARRQMLVREINKYYPVDTYGRCGDNTLPSENVGEVLKKYRFYLAFENSYCRNYITEKLLHPLKSNIIPVAVGGPEYKKMAPPNSYIDVLDFNSVENLTQYLKYLDRNPTAYNSYFKWNNVYEVTACASWCAVCKVLHEEGRVHQVYTDIEGYFDNDTCLRGTLKELGLYTITYGRLTKVIAPRSLWKRIPWERYKNWVRNLNRNEALLSEYDDYDTFKAFQAVARPSDRGDHK